ncbi:hypothetical protein [Sansalvadorimonas verongulae]|uniref:hypothetical protein n=1 Tax=Sansalvadorimonas verongulae TaxID=2172824 RepID=UPI0012BD675C|nr:hypothetical protein [Sansalvadorimonas verongulae]MTI13477.1 hypothetical protein [Sansalvadorimonas verongulae]
MNNNVTDRSIHLLDKCLTHQRTRFDHARLRAHQSAMLLRTQKLQFEKLSSALEEYRLKPAAQKPMNLTNQAGFRKLLLDVKELQREQVKLEEIAYQQCQEEALKEQQKIKTMEKVLEKLRSRQRQQAARKEQTVLDDQVAAQLARH